MPASTYWYFAGDHIKKLKLGKLFFVNLSEFNLKIWDEPKLEQVWALTNFYLGILDIKRQLSRRGTARGSSNRILLFGPTKVKACKSFFYSLKVPLKLKIILNALKSNHIFK